jgi:hypothetical protein
VIFTIGNFIMALAFMGAMIAAQAWGQRRGQRDRDLAADSKSGPSAAETASFALLGLMLAFTFSGAAIRFDERRQLIIQEANAIGTAWLRIDMLPADRQTELRNLFRQYLDARLETYRNVQDQASIARGQAKAASLQAQIWSRAVDAGAATGQIAIYSVLLPALNEMIDITTTRTAVTTIHAPAVVFALIAVLAVITSMFAGYGMAGSPARTWFHRYGFALVIALSLAVIIDLEFPRLGLIRVEGLDQVLVELRRSLG